MDEKAKKDTRKVSIAMDLYEMAEAAIPLVSSKMGFKVTAVQVVAWAARKGLLDAVSEAREQGKVA